MFSVIAIVVVFVGLFILLNLKNRFAYAIALMLFGLILLTITAAVYSSRVAFSRLPGGFDYDALLFFYNMRLSLTAIVQIYNLCLTFMMLVCAGCFVMFCRIRLRYTPILAILPALFAFWISPEMTYQLHIFKLSSAQGAVVCDYGNIAAEAVFWLYIFAPAAEAFRQFAVSKLFTRRRELLVAGLCYIALDLYLLIIFRLRDFSFVWFNHVDFTKLPSPAQSDANTFTLVPALMLGVFGVILTLLLYFHPFSTFKIVRRDDAYKLKQLFDKNLSMQLHVYKNAFLAIGYHVSLINASCEKGDFTSVSRGVGLCSNIVKENLAVLDSTLQMLRVSGKGFSGGETDLAECVKYALAKTVGSKPVQLSGNYETASAIVRGDAYHLTECFVNILTNALEAIQKTQRPPEIRIDFTQEADCYMLEFIDNGTGIDKKDIRHIFEPFYSTKPRNKCGGIGLDYVKNVTLGHGGAVRALSRTGEGANFQFVFPAFAQR